MGNIDESNRRAKGPREVAFQKAYGSEEQCRAALFEWRWDRGWSCPPRSHGGHCYLQKWGRLPCDRYKHQVSVTVGKIFHGTKLPLKVWSLAIYHDSLSKGGISSADPGRRLGVREAKVWLIEHKLMAAMQAREEAKPKLEGRSR